MFCNPDLTILDVHVAAKGGSRNIGCNARSHGGLRDRAFSRQQWRERIETSAMAGQVRQACTFSRQQWRERIETIRYLGLPQMSLALSPVSNGGSGLKHDSDTPIASASLSPVSNGGSGLKLFLRRRGPG